ncbi:hypothetical protein PSAC2689_100017 [Paraburkholderia sacchari]
MKVRSAYVLKTSARRRGAEAALGDFDKAIAGFPQDFNDTNSLRKNLFKSWNGYKLFLIM